MDESPPLAVLVGVGTTTSVGGHTAESCASMRAGLARFTTTPIYLAAAADPEREDPDLALVAPVLEPTLGIPLPERLLRLALPALAEGIEAAGWRRDEFGIAGLHVVLPQSSRPLPPGIAEQVPHELCRRAGISTRAPTTTVRSGHHGFAEAVQRVIASFGAGLSRSVVLLVDSLLDAETMAWLDQRDRLKCARVPDGLIPGEAAAACLFESPSTAAASGASVLARVEGVGVAEESATVLSDLACTGTGLSEALRLAAQGLPLVRPPWVVSDHNGERYRAQELGYLFVKQHRLLGGLRETWFPASSLGDVGAAAGGIAAAWIAQAFARGYAPSRRAFVLTSSDDGGRGVVVIGAPDAGEA